MLLLVGPTAVGKTGLSLPLAEKLAGEIVAADSRQVYRYMDIGTAKPTREEQQRIPHHFIDIRDPDQYYSAGEYGREARRCIEDLLAQGRQPVVVGGSGFYISALVDGLFAPKISDPEVKIRWRQRIDEQGLPAVFHYLQQVDPITAARLHANDAQRMVRALEVYELTGRPISDFHKGQEEPARFTPVFVGLTRPRHELCRRIEQRVDAMLAAGLVEEVKNLQERGYGPGLNALQTVGYQEVFQYLAGQIDYRRMTDLIKIHSRRYAKRQMTWFRRDSRIQWLDIEKESIESAVRTIYQVQEKCCR